ncbi:MAG: AAA family ATPase [Lachnospiraceae bacterium]|nr:AAA family ATPase [Lachnospiraceae bacterium]
MGFYLNPPADDFAAVLNTGLYVDKTQLIQYTNSVLNSAMKLTCVSRPRRFGKSFAAKMLAAYYSKGANSKELFQNLKIAKSKEFAKHLNRYDVLSLDITWFISNAPSIRDTVTDMQKYVIEELREVYPDCISSNISTLPMALAQIGSRTGTKFFIIIDEWDALFREAKDDIELQKSYLQLLRGLFKGMQISQFVIGAYMTGILPIKKYGTQSALTDFFEYTMIEPGTLAEYVGFTEKEVRQLCEEHSLDYEEASTWYDGYQLGTVGHVYSPNSIIKAIYNKRFSNYWTQTETYESLKIYIDMDFDGLKTAIVNMLGGGRCVIDTGTFQNDMTSLKSKDDVFTLLVHLGYLAYDADKKEVFIPNEEVREEFIRAIKNGGRPELVKAVLTSDELLAATLRMDSETVAKLIDEAHSANTAPNFYNNEQALRSVILMAYLSSVDHYSKIQELTSGTGYADIMFLPNRGSDKPVMIVELKWNKTSDGAIAQIKDRKYAQALENYGGDILLVGINYDVKSKKHQCTIENIKKY